MSSRLGHLAWTQAPPRAHEWCPRRGNKALGDERGKSLRVMGRGCRAQGSGWWFLKLSGVLRDGRGVRGPERHCRQDPRLVLCLQQGLGQ